MSFARHSDVVSDVLVALAEEGEEDEEEVDDVNVELQSAEDVLLWGQLVLPAANDHLSVVDQELKQLAVHNRKWSVVPALTQIMIT